MASSVSSETSFRDSFVDQVRLLDEQQEKLYRTLDQKLHENTPEAKNPALQDELNKTHALYLKVVSDSKKNLEQQQEIIREFKNKLASEENLTPLQLCSFFQIFQYKISPLQQEHAENTLKTVMSEDRIKTLMNSN